MWGGNHQCLSFYSIKIQSVAWRQTALERWASPGSPFSLRGTTGAHQCSSLSFPVRASVTKWPIVKGPQSRPFMAWAMWTLIILVILFQEILLCAAHVSFSVDLLWLIWNDQGQQSALFIEMGLEGLEIVVVSLPPGWWWWLDSVEGRIILKKLKAS